MAHVVVIGAGLGGLPTAYELRRLLPCQHQITLISAHPKFTYLPSLPWVGLDLLPLEQVQVDIGKHIEHRNINWISQTVTALNPETQEISTASRTLTYDRLVIAPGAELNLDCLPGLGPEGGFTQSVCNPHHATLACQAWRDFLKEPGPLLVGAVPGASCFGPAYEFALLADYVLRRRGLRGKVKISFITPEPYAGQLGIGGMANSAKLVTKLMAERNIEVVENAAISQIDPQRVTLADGRRLPFRYAMFLPPFRGPEFLRQVRGLADSNGFLPVKPTYDHPHFTSLYGVGTVTQLSPPEPTPLPVGVPKTGQMAEAMAMAVAHNIAVDLGVIRGNRVTPTLEAICFADFGDTGILFLADPVLPDPTTGKRRRAIALSGAWVGWLKKAFERYFLLKMRWGMAVPWFERLALRGAGLSLVQPLREPPSVLSVS